MLVRLDTALLNKLLRRVRTDRLDALMLIATRLGDWGMIWIVYALLMLCLSDKRPAARALFFAVLLCAVVGNCVIKPLFRRARPCNARGAIRLPLLLKRPKDSSFPSCHSMTSFAAVAVLSHAGGLLGLTSLFFAGAISFSRMYLQVHYPSDVLLGALMGIAAGRLFV